MVSVLGAMMLLGSTLFTTNPCSAAVVWSDDFTDGDIAGWTVELGSFSAIDNTLRATGTPSALRHDTSTTQGTWSFDVDITQGTAGIYITLFADVMVAGICDSCYTLFVSNYQWQCQRATSGSNTVLDTYNPTENIVGWYHVDVTRDASGQFYFWINGTHRMDALDNIENTANYFGFWGDEGDALDNIVISDSVDIAAPTNTGTGTTPPPPIPGFPLASIILGGALALSIGLVTRKPRRDT
jgi:pectate lyase